VPALRTGLHDLLSVLLAEFQRGERLAGARDLHLDAVIVIVIEIDAEPLRLTGG